MIQRIQTVYLLLVMLLSGITLFSVQAHFVAVEPNVAQYFLNYKGLFEISKTGIVHTHNFWSYALTTVVALVIILTYAAIFSYKKRLLQIRLSIINCVLLTGYYGLLAFNVWQASNKLHASWILEITTAFPLVCIVLTLLAIRAINKDEALIKSLNRLR